MYKKIEVIFALCLYGNYLTDVAVSLVERVFAHSQCTTKAYNTTQVLFISTFVLHCQHSYYVSLTSIYYILCNTLHRTRIPSLLSAIH